MMKNLTKALLVCLMVTLTSTAVRAQGITADASDLEKQFYGIVQKRVKDRTDAAGVVVNSLAKYSLGASAYNAVKKAYASGGDTKAKIDAMMAELVSEKP